MEPAFAITFAPSMDPPALAVTVRAKARAGLERWSSITHALPGSIAVHDASGAIVTQTKDGAIELARAPKDFVELVYSLPARAEGDVVLSNAGYVRFYGEPLLLPDAFAQEKTHVTIDFDLAKAPVEGVASSFGNGKHVETDVALGDLSKGAWMAGAVFDARFNAYEGKDHFSWIGYSAFDPRWVSAEIATLRTSVSQWFGDKEPPPFEMLFTIDRRSSIESSPISIYPRWHGLFAIVDIDAPWSISARMWVALALVSRFVSASGLVTGPAAPGLARFAAREILLASGTMTPLEYEAEVNGEIAATLFADKNPRAAEIASIVLDATRVDALLRKTSGGKRSLRDVMREWIISRHAVSGSELAAVARGDLADDALGKCFARTPTHFEELDLGFDESETRASKKLTHVHGPATKAGLKEGEPLVSIRYDDSNAEHPVRVIITRDGKDVTVTYRPVGRTKVAQGWRVLPGMDPSTCARSGG
jgi:hypothetical protein